MREHEGGDHDGQQVRQQHRRRRRRAAMPGRMGWAPSRTRARTPRSWALACTPLVWTLPAWPQRSHRRGRARGRPAGARVVQHPEEGVHEHLAHPQRRDGAPVLQRTRVVARASGSAIPVRRKGSAAATTPPPRACAPTASRTQAALATRARATQTHRCAATSRLDRRNCPGRARPGPAVRNAPLQPHRLGTKGCPLNEEEPWLTPPAP